MAQIMIKEDYFWNTIIKIYLVLNVIMQLAIDVLLLIGWYLNLH